MNMIIWQILNNEIGQNEKNDTQQEYVWHLNTQTRGCTWGKKGGLKGGSSLLILSEGVD